MCGILAFINNLETEEAIKAFLLLAERGKDNYGISDFKETFHSKSKEEIVNKIKTTKSPSLFLHALHAVTGFCPQPLSNAFITNCEIYNWKELAKKHSLKAENDAELLYKLLELKGSAALDELDGDYAFIYKKGSTIIATTDLFGVKPLFYREDSGLALASEQKALPNLQKLNPRKILVYENNTLSFQNKSFPQLKEELLNKEKTKSFLTKAVKKRTHDLDNFGILFSGGLDSTLLAKICKDLGKNPTLYAIGVPGSQDLASAKEAASILGLKLISQEVTQQEIHDSYKQVFSLLDENPVQLSIATTINLACKLIKEKVVLSGLGADELFAGYARFRQKQSNEECLNSLLNVHRDCYRDDVVTMHNGIELRVPYLDKGFAIHALKIPFTEKIKEHNKHILREIAKDFGVPERIAFRKKTAAQYGSGIQKALKKGLNIT